MKQKIDTVIYHRTKNTPIIWKDIKHLQFEDDDEITCQYEEEYYSENNSYDAHYFVTVRRQVEETDAQYKSRLQKESKDKERALERRRETYLKLKQEFENT